MVVIFEHTAHEEVEDGIWERRQYLAPVSSSRAISSRKYLHCKQQDMLFQLNKTEIPFNQTQNFSQTVVTFSASRVLSWCLCKQWITVALLARIEPSGSFMYKSKGQSPLCNRGCPVVGLRLSILCRLWTELELIQVSRKLGDIPILSGVKFETVVTVTHNCLSDYYLAICANKKQVLISLSYLLLFIRIQFVSRQNNNRHNHNRNNMTMTKLPPPIRCHFDDLTYWITICEAPLPKCIRI